MEKMWVKICNLNRIPKIGATESHSCQRRDLFWKFALKPVCWSTASLRPSGHYSLGMTFLLPEPGMGGGGGCTHPCLILGTVWLARFTFAQEPPHKRKVPTDVGEHSWRSGVQSFHFSAISLCGWIMRKNEWWKCCAGSPVLTFILYLARSCCDTAASQWNWTEVFCCDLLHKNI